MPLTGSQLEIAKLQAAQSAVKQVTSTFTYSAMGMTFNVGNYITDEEVTQVAAAVLKAITEVEAANT